jgi:DNA-binding transcriptional LysR family regulator
MQCAFLHRIEAVNCDNLRYFLELVRAGTLVTAAQRLNVDHTTVSRRILALENEIGSQVFERRASGYQLTGSGKRLLAHVEAIENSTLAIESAISGRKDLARVRVVWSYLRDLVAREQLLLLA